MFSGSGSKGAASKIKPWAALRRFAQPPATVERCEFCSAELPPDHEHVVEPANRRLLCACQACAILFEHDAGTKYRRVPRQGRYLSNFHLTDVQWNRLDVPIGLAFFLYSTPAARVVAIYPSPAGPTESLLDLDCWNEIAEQNPAVRDMTPDAEALLVNRLRMNRDYFVAPIDECYKLIGLIRMHWRGITGGAEVRQEIDRFYAGLKQRSLDSPAPTR